MKRAKMFTGKTRLNFFKMEVSPHTQFYELLELLLLNKEITIIYKRVKMSMILNFFSKKTKKAKKTMCITLSWIYKEKNLINYPIRIILNYTKMKLQCLKHSKSRPWDTKPVGLGLFYGAEQQIKPNKCRVYDEFVLKNEWVLSGV